MNYTEIGMGKAPVGIGSPAVEKKSWFKRSNKWKTGGILASAIILLALCAVAWSNNGVMMKNPLNRNVFVPVSNTQNVVNPGMGYYHGMMPTSVYSDVKPVSVFQPNPNVKVVHMTNGNMPVHQQNVQNMHQIPMHHFHPVPVNAHLISNHAPAAQHPVFAPIRM